MEDDINYNSTSSGSGTSKQNATTTVVTERIIRAPSLESSSEVTAATKHEEWTSTKKVVNRKSRQVETRVQRQIMYEDGKVVEDSGPQITTKTTEDNHKEEIENTDYKATGGDDLSLDDRGSARLVTEKIVTKHTVRENKEESKQLCDESFQDVTGTDFLNKIPDHSDGSLSQGEDLNKSLPEKIIHYFCYDQKVRDKEEIKEVSELKNGELITETSRTQHYEDQHEILENEAYEATMSKFSTEINKNTEYYEDRSENMRIPQEREQNILRRDSITKADLDVEKEEIKKYNANRWLKHHFGSDSRSEFEPLQTKQTKNVIHVQFNEDSKIPSHTQFDKECVKSDLTFPQGYEEQNKNYLSKTFHEKTKTKNFLGISEWDSKPRKLSEAQTSALPSYKESAKTTPLAGLGKDNFNYILSNYQLNSPRQGSSRLLSQYIPRKSKAFVIDENKTTLEEEDRDKKNREHKLEVFHSENQTPDNGSSYNEVSRNLAVSEEGMSLSTGNFYNSVMLHILPQNTRFIDESSPQTIDRADRFVQVNLLEDAYHPTTFPTSPQKFSEECGIHTPYKTSSVNLCEEREQVSAVRTPRTYYFGDELNVSYHGGAKNKTHESEILGESINYKQLSNINNSNFGNVVGSYIVQQKDSLKSMPKQSSEQLNVSDLNNSHYHAELRDNIYKHCHEDTKVESDVSQEKGSYHHSCYNIYYGDESNRKDTEITIVNNESSSGLYEKQKEFMHNLPDFIHPSNEVMQMSITTNYNSRHQRRNSPPSSSEDNDILKDSRTPYLMKVKETSTFDVSSSSQIESSEKSPLCPTPSPPVGGVFVCTTLPKYFSEERSIRPHPHTPGTTVTSFKAMPIPLDIKDTCTKTTVTLIPNHKNHEENKSVKTSRKPETVLVEVRDWNNR